MPSGQMVRLKYGRIQPGSTVRQTIQQMKRECVLRSETRQGQTGGSNAFVGFAFYFVRLRNLDFISLTNESPWRTLNFLRISCDEAPHEAVQNYGHLCQEIRITWCSVLKISLLTCVSQSGFANNLSDQFLIASVEVRRAPWRDRSIVSNNGFHLRAPACILTEPSQ
jgi:hypothetical protein